MQMHSASFSSCCTTAMRHRDLIGQLTLREFRTRYRGSVLGIVWAVITPLATVLVFLFVFGVIFHARWGTAPNSTAEFVIIVLFGTVIHGAFAETLGRAPQLILGQPAYVKRVVFPLEIVPLVAVAQAFINATIALMIVLGAAAIVRGVAPTALWLPLILAPYFLFLVGMAFFVSATAVYLRDLSHVAGFVTTGALFLAPIFYPISAVPDPYRRLLYANPLTFAVEQARSVTLFGQSPDWPGLAIYASVALATAWLGYAWFQRIRHGFADVM